jgi:hypothetical protein
VRRSTLVLAALALLLTGCETTAEKSAKLERQALRADTGSPVAKGLSIAHASSAIEVIDSALVRGPEAAAATITLRNNSDRPIANVPLMIEVKDSHGVAVYSNGAAGLAHSLISAPLIGAHADLTWVDDQVIGAGSARTVAAKVGEGSSVGGPIPRLTVEGAHLFEEPGSGFGAKGTIVNHSSVAQHELVVYATARRAGKLVAAGRAVLAEVPGAGSTPFQLFFIGDPRGTGLQVSVPPSTLP